MIHEPVQLLSKIIIIHLLHVLHFSFLIFQCVYCFFIPFALHLRCLSDAHDILTSHDKIHLTVCQNKF